MPGRRRGCGTAAMTALQEEDRGDVVSELSSEQDLLLRCAWVSSWCPWLWGFQEASKRHQEAVQADGSQSKGTARPPQEVVSRG